MAEGGETPDYYMMDYHPYHGGNNPNRDEDSQTLLYLKGDNVYDSVRRQNFLSKIKSFMVEKVLKDLLSQPEVSVTLVLVPGHSPTSPPGFLKEIILELVKDHCQCMAQSSPPEKQRLFDGSNQLVRIKGVPKSATTPGRRSVSIHQDSIAVNEDLPVKVNEGRVVCILDDVWTSGSTMKACVEKIRSTGASDIKTVVVGKTVN